MKHTILTTIVAIALVLTAVPTVAAAVPDAEVDHITFDIDETSVQFDQTTRYTVTAHYSNGTTENVSTAATVTSGDSSVVSVQSPNHLRGEGDGSATITAEYDGHVFSTELTTRGPFTGVENGDVRSVTVPGPQVSDNETIVETDGSSGSQTFESKDSIQWTGTYHTSGFRYGHWINTSGDVNIRAGLNTSAAFEGLEVRRSGANSFVREIPVTWENDSVYELVFTRLPNESAHIELYENQSLAGEVTTPHGVAYGTGDWNVNTVKSGQSATWEMRDRPRVEFTGNGTVDEQTSIDIAFVNDDIGSLGGGDYEVEWDVTTSGTVSQVELFIWSSGTTTQDSFSTSDRMGTGTMTVPGSFINYTLTANVTTAAGYTYSVTGSNDAVGYYDTNNAPTDEGNGMNDFWGNDYNETFQGLISTENPGIDPDGGALFEFDGKLADGESVQIPAAQHRAPASGDTGWHANAEPGTQFDWRYIGASVTDTTSQTFSTTSSISSASANATGVEIQPGKTRFGHNDTGDYEVVLSYENGTTENVDPTVTSNNSTILTVHNGNNSFQTHEFTGFVNVSTSITRDGTTHADGVMMVVAPPSIANCRFSTGPACMLAIVTDWGFVFLYISALVTARICKEGGADDMVCIAVGVVAVMLMWFYNLAPLYLLITSFALGTGIFLVSPPGVAVEIQQELVDKT